LLALYPALASITVTQTQALWAVNRPGLTSIVAMARLAVTIVLLVALTPQMHLVGPALAMLAGYVVVVFFSGLALRHYLTTPLRATWPLRERFALLPAYAIGFGAAHVVEGALPSILALPVCLLAGTLAYVSALLVSGGVNIRDRQRLAELTAWIQARFGGGEATPPAALPD
jgi:O-antigen/teichoic acid export membrane protein